jgi:adhesin/invasin
MVSGPLLETTSGAILLMAGTPSEMIGVQPLMYQATVGSPVTPPPSVLVKDGAGNPVPGVTVTFSTDRDGAVSPTSVVSNASGRAQVTSWALGSSTGQYSLTARVEGSAIAPIVFSATASAGAAGRLEILTQPPSSAQSSAVFEQQPVIRIVDRNGNPTPQGGVTLTATITAGPAGTLDNASATTNASGTATFDGLTLTGTVGNYVLTFTASGLPGVNSSTISLAPGAPAGLASVGEAPSGRSREALSPQPAIQVQDASGNSVPQSGIVVQASLTGDGALGGITTMTTDATGVARFTDLSITGAPGSRTLVFTSTAMQTSIEARLAGVASIEPNAAAPASAVVGTTMSDAATWTLRDGGGNPVADVPVVLTASPGGAVTPASLTSDPAGVVRVVWTLGQAAGDQFVEVAVTGGPTSQIHINAIPDVPAKLLAISGDGQSGPVNTDLDSLLVVRLVDQYDNGVSGVPVNWQACEGGEIYPATTNAQGYSSALQPAGATAGGPFCTRASAAGLSVDFTYTVTSSSTSSQLRARSGSPLRFRGAAPVAPPRRFKAHYSR